METLGKLAHFVLQFYQPTSNFECFPRGVSSYHRYTSCLKKKIVLYQSWPEEIKAENISQIRMIEAAYMIEQIPWQIWKSEPRKEIME